MNKLIARARAVAARTTDAVVDTAMRHPRVTAAAVITAATIAAPVVTTTIVATRGMIALIDDANRIALRRRFGLM